MNKQDISDLKSHIDRLVQTSVDHRNAELAKLEAGHMLDRFLSQIRTDLPKVS